MSRLSWAIVAKALEVASYALMTTAALAFFALYFREGIRRMVQP